MKPILIPCSPDKDGKVHITMKELSDMLDKAYNAGKSDGSPIQYNCPYKWYWCNGTGLTTNPYQTDTTWTTTTSTSNTIDTILNSGNSITVNTKK